MSNFDILEVIESRRRWTCIGVRRAEAIDAWLWLLLTAGCILAARVGSSVEVVFGIIANASVMVASGDIG